MAVSARPYELPAPFFGPGSPGYVSHQLANLSVAGGTFVEYDEDGRSTPGTSNYSGAGTYF